MPAETFAFLDFGGDRFGQLIVHCLAVAGAFLVGYFVSGLLAWLFDRRLTGGKSPGGLHKTIKNIGGIGLAILAAFILFGHGQGWTMFGGGSDGEGNGTGDEKGNGPGTGSVVVTTQPTERDTRPTARAPVPPSDPGTKIERVAVTVLAGESVRDGKFFQIGDDPTPRTLRELEAELKARREASQKPVGVMPLYPPNSGGDTPGASLLFGLTRREGYSVIHAETPK